MCRILIYKGIYTNIKKLLWLPNNSLFKQSFKEPYTPFLKEPNYRNHSINVDGSGIAWFTDQYDDPCIYKTTKPPWDDLNLLNLCKYVDTFLLFSHIRGIKPFSKYSIVHDYNSHPFNYKNLLWMHNGDIENLLNIKKYIYSNVDNEFLLNIKGNTDSEYCFALFLNFLKKLNANIMVNKVIYFSIDNLKKAMELTIYKVNELTNSNCSSLNFFFTDGKSIICSRYLNSFIEDPPSLYYSIGKEFIYDSKKNIIKDVNKSKDCVIISSEPLYQKKEDWNLIKKNVIMSVNENNEIDFKNLNTNNFLSE